MSEVPSSTRPAKPNRPLSRAIPTATGGKRRGPPPPVKPKPTSAVLPTQGASDTHSSLSGSPAKAPPGNVEGGALSATEPDGEVWDSNGDQSESEVECDCAYGECNCSSILLEGGLTGVQGGMVPRGRRPSSAHYDNGDYNDGTVFVDDVDGCLSTELPTVAQITESSEWAAAQEAAADAPPPRPPRPESCAAPPRPARLPQPRAYVAIAPYEKQNEDELGFRTGQLITVQEIPEGGWWHGVINHAILGKLEGWFPSNHVEIPPWGRTISVQEEVSGGTSGAMYMNIEPKNTEALDLLQSRFARWNFPDLSSGNSSVLHEGSLLMISAASTVVEGLGGSRTRSSGSISAKLAEMKVKVTQSAAVKAAAAKLHQIAPMKRCPRLVILLDRALLWARKRSDGKLELKGWVPTPQTTEVALNPKKTSDS